MARQRGAMHAAATAVDGRAVPNQQPLLILSTECNLVLAPQLRLPDIMVRSSLVDGSAAMFPVVLASTKGAPGAVATSCIPLTDRPVPV